MDFHQQDIRQFLQESIPYRFRQLSPPEFEDFISYLFEVDGYDILPVEQAGQPDSVILARKDDITLTIIALRQSPEELLGEESIRKAYALNKLYNSDQSWVVTTTSFIPEARQLAEELDIELWDWDALYEALCQLFFEGKNHVAYIQEHPPSSIPIDRDPELKLKVKWQAAEGVGSEWFNLGLTVTNPTDRNIYLHLDIPALIDHSRNQVMADEWAEGDFVSGMIYAGASIKTNALFSVAKLGDRPPGGKIVMTCHERIEVPVTYHLQAKLQGQACFIVTYCYTTNSPEYRMMTQFRDKVLAGSLPGRIFIRSYYFLSPHLVTIASYNQFVDKMVRRFTAWLIKRIRISANSRTII